MINETGYVNFVTGSEDDGVYGSPCSPSYRDEIAFDESEGVPLFYKRIKLKVRDISTPEKE